MKRQSTLCQSKGLKDLRPIVSTPAVGSKRWSWGPKIFSGRLYPTFIRTCILLFSISVILASFWALPNNSMVIFNFRSECMKLVVIYVQLNHINFTWWNCIHFSRVFSSNRDARQHQIHQCGMGKHQLERKHFNKWWPIYRVFIRDSSSLYHTNH